MDERQRPAFQRRIAGPAAGDRGRAITSVAPRPPRPVRVAPRSA
jgi:hypothetical protein